MRAMRPRENDGLLLGQSDNTDIQETTDNGPKYTDINVASFWLHLVRISMSRLTPDGDDGILRYWNSAICFFYIPTFHSKFQWLSFQVLYHPSQIVTFGLCFGCFQFLWYNKKLLFSISQFAQVNIAQFFAGLMIWAPIPSI
jgi:hypothetical protein